MPLTPYSHVVKGSNRPPSHKWMQKKSLSSMLSLILATLFPILRLFLSSFNKSDMIGMFGRSRNFMGSRHVNI